MNTETSILLLLQDSRSSDVWLLDGLGLAEPVWLMGGSGLAEAVLDAEPGDVIARGGGRETRGPEFAGGLETKGLEFAGGLSEGK